MEYNIYKNNNWYIIPNKKWAEYADKNKLNCNFSLYHKKYWLNPGLTHKNWTYENSGNIERKLSPDTVEISFEEFINYVVKSDNYEIY